MSLDTFTFQSEAFQRSIQRTWELIRSFRGDVEWAATHIDTINPKSGSGSQEDVEATPSHYHPLSRFERLPEEIHMHIMECLDHENLYRLSQTTAHFLKLSFDSTFEADPSWRAFRHTVDGLGEGPRRRILEGASVREAGRVILDSPEQEEPSSLLPSSYDQGDGNYLSEQNSPEKRRVVTLDGSDDEAETMHSFMAKQY
ncbi:hypothetical protein F5X96DRAFT_662804 [Biscogniauxia mediterranea]|nr:hypothetical protein F5X96DRAFT_662804 [Biscogniauxia mediterranea]